MNEVKPNAKRSWLIFIWGLGLVPAVGAIISTRPFPSSGWAPSDGLNHAGGWLVLAWTLLLGCAGIATRGMAIRIWNRRVALWLGAVALSAGPLLASRWALIPDFSPSLLAVPLVFTAAFLFDPVPMPWFVAQIKRVVAVYAYGSLAVAAVLPHWAIEFNYAGFLPFRLHGLSTHANNLAPLLAVYVVLDLAYPAASRLQKVTWAVVCLTLVLTQSKTMILALLCGYAVMIWTRTWRRGGMVRYLGLSAALLMSAAVGLTMFFFDTTAAGDVFGTDATTLTGRTSIWAWTVSAWSQNPLLGYGMTLWDKAMSSDYAALYGFAPPHAHSQIFQTLGESGIVGMAGLLLYAITLMVYGIRYFRVSGGATLSLVVVMLVRSVTEPSFRTVIDDGNFFVHFSMFALLAVAVTCQHRSLAAEAEVPAAGGAA